MSALTENDLHYQQALAAANKFAVEDLEANRQGWMTDRQSSKLRWRPVIGCFGLLLLVGGILILSALAAVISSGQAGGFIPFLIGAVLAAIGLFVARRWHKEIKEKRVERYEGVVLKEEEDKKIHHQGGLIPALMAALAGAALSAMGVKNYFYKLDNGMRMPVSKVAYLALDQFRPHRVYYSPRSHILLAVEALPDPNPGKSVPKFGQP